MASQSPVPAFACSAGTLTAANLSNSVVDVCIGRLGLLGTQLQQTSSQVEEAVVEVCESFSSIAAKAQAETERLVALLDPADTRTPSFESLLRSCSATLQRLLNMQATTNDMVETTMGNLQQINQAALKIEKTLLMVEEISLGNRLLALNARIEASRSPENERGFNAVAVELAAQTERTNKLTGQVADLSNFLKDLANTTVQSLAVVQAESLAVGASVRAETDRTLTGLAEGYRAMREAVGQSQSESSQLADHIAIAIRGMQFQDRVSQQIAHVVHDLGVLEQRLGDRVSGMDVDSGSMPGFSDMVMHEERAIYGDAGPESEEGDIELF